MIENQTNPGIEKSSLEEKQLEFEKYKIKIELYKWLIGSVALVLLTTIIDYGFRDRTAGLQEIQQYDKYITDLIVLNKEPGQKRMLAQFFANVTPSDKLKKGWYKYYQEVDKEYQIMIAPVLKNDSILKSEYNNLLENSSDSSSNKNEQLSLLETKIEENERLIHPDIILPSKSVIKDYNSALDWESKGFSFLFEKDIDNAILAFRSSENAYNRFHQVYEISKYLSENKSLLKDSNSEFWKTAFGIIAKDYSWKMPIEIRRKLLEKSKK
jgi:hypothetical protein